MPRCAQPPQSTAAALRALSPTHMNLDIYSPYLAPLQDLALREWLVRFQKCDLYSKSATLPDMRALRPYYEQLVEKYCPGFLNW